MDDLDDAPPRRKAPKPVSTVEELRALDEDAVIAGYRAGISNTPDYSRGDRSYWHGYMNGCVDGGRAKISPEQQALAKEYVGSGALKSDVERWKRAA